MQGDLWFDTTNTQLYVYSGTAFILVGPTSVAGSGVTNAIAETLQDNAGVNRTILKLVSNYFKILKINLILNFGVSPNMSSIQYNAVNAITQMFAKIKCVESEKYSEPNNNISGPTTPAPVGVLIFLLKLRKNFI